MVALLYLIEKVELETIKVEIADFPFFSHQLIVGKVTVTVILKYTSLRVEWGMYGNSIGKLQTPVPHIMGFLRLGKSRINWTWNQVNIHLVQI